MTVWADGPGGGTPITADELNRIESTLDGLTARPSASPLSTITGRLHRGVEDVVLTVLGDSTGNSEWEWPYLVAEWLAVQYPAYTVLHRLWNETGVVYDAATTIQTGTGSRTLTVYNGSTPGKIGSYSTPILAAQVPVVPHAVIINYGHNPSSLTSVRPDTYPLLRAVREAFPFAAVVLTAQNPRASSDANFVNALARQQSNIDLAQSEGLGLINVLQVFLDNPTYAADWLSGDGLHPNAAGMLVWRDTVIAHLRDDQGAVPQGPRGDLVSQLWLPATAFVAKAGTPTRVDTHDLGPYWSLPDTGTTAVSAQVSVPSSWDRIHFYAKWLQVSVAGFTSANNTIRTRTTVRGFGPPGYDVAPVTAPVTTGSSSAGDISVSANNAATADRVKTSYLGYTTLITSSRGNIFSLDVRRLGDDVADTNVDAWLLLGVMALRQT